MSIELCPKCEGRKVDISRIGCTIGTDTGPPACQVCNGKGYVETSKPCYELEQISEVLTHGDLYKRKETEPTHVKCPECDYKWRVEGWDIKTFFKCSQCNCVFKIRYFKK
jgi:hypothetical protein